MKTLLSALLIFSLTSDKFSIIGKWQGLDTHEQKIEVTILENLNASILYPELPKNNVRNQEITYTSQATQNDSLVYIDFDKSVRNMEGHTKRDTSYCSIKFLNETNIVLMEHSNPTARKTGKGTKISLKKI